MFAHQNEQPPFSQRVPTVLGGLGACVVLAACFLPAFDYSFGATNLLGIEVPFLGIQDNNMNVLLLRGPVPVLSRGIVLCSFLSFSFALMGRSKWQLIAAPAVVGLAGACFVLLHALLRECLDRRGCLTCDITPKYGWLVLAMGCVSIWLAAFVSDKWVQDALHSPLSTDGTGRVSPSADHSGRQATASGTTGPGRNRAGRDNPYDPPESLPSREKPQFDGERLFMELFKLTFAVIFVAIGLVLLFEILALLMLTVPPPRPRQGF